MEMKMRKFAGLIEELESIKGRHTELVTIYIPAGYNINKASEQIRAEQSTAQNIKSKTVRKNVMAALEKILAHLKGYRQTPPLGIAIFCGNVSQKEGVADIQIFVVEPSEELRTKMYQCDQHFALEPLKEMVAEKEIYGLIVLDKSEADIGLLSGKRIESLKHMESLVPGKTKKGGWSANRFARVREGLLEDFLKMVGKAASTEFMQIKNLKGVIIGGPGPIKEDFLEGDHLNYQVKKLVLGTVNTSYTGEPGLEETVERSQDLISEAAAIRENKIMERFFTDLAKDTGLAVYGERTRELLKQGVVELLLISEPYFKEHEDEMDKLLKEAEQMNTAVEIVSPDSPRGRQFKEIGGLGGILRYKA